MCLISVFLKFNFTTCVTLQYLLSKYIKFAILIGHAGVICHCWRKSCCYCHVTQEQNCEFVSIVQIIHLYVYQDVVYDYKALKAASLQFSLFYSFRPAVLIFLVQKQDEDF